MATRLVPLRKARYAVAVADQSGDPADALIAQCRRELAPHLKGQPLDWVLVGGSGIGAALGDGESLPKGIELELSIPLADLGLPVPSVAGHAKSLILARVGASRVAIQTGRIHPYEGHDPRVCTAALRALLESRPGALLLTCAVGALRKDLTPGQLVLLRDQIGLWGPSALRGPQFADCSRIYGEGLRSAIQACVQDYGLPRLEELVYIHARGPQYETPAEVQALRMMGGDVVGMSTTYEATLAAFYRVPTAGIALVTNSAGAHGLTHHEVEEQGRKSWWMPHKVP